VAGVPAAASAAAATTTSAVADSGIIKTAAVVGFNAENIISDALFYDSNAMSAAEIQSFLDAKIGACQNGKCLNVLTTGISSRGAVVSQTTGNLICSAIQGGSMRVSELIYRVQAACGISAKVILTTLQKEQGLTTSSAPSDWNLTAAMGASCPDTAPCDPAFAGVGPQILKGTQQLKTYKAANFAKQPGVNYIAWSPTASCGGTNLNIQNYATAALYNYTPYQPNAAALAAGYGLGDGCSSYGNRNFYNYYTQWFGSTQSSGGYVVRSATSGSAYLIAQGTRYKFPTDERAVQFTWIGTARTMSDADIAAFTDGGEAPRAVRTTTGNLYVLDSGTKVRIASCDIAADYGWNCQTLPLLTQGQVDVYGDNGWLERVVRTSSTMWLVQQKVRREVLDLGLLPRYGIPTNVTNVSPTFAGEYATGDPVLGQGVYGSASGRVVAVTGAGTYDLPSAALIGAVNDSRRTIQDESMKRITSSSTLPVRAKVAGRTVLMSDGGWLTADAYGDGAGFTVLPDGALAGMPSARTVSGPHFVRENSDPQVFLASYGTLQAVSDADQAWVRARYGVAARVWVVADGALALPPAPTGISVVSAPDGALYLVDRGQRFRLSGCGQAVDLGVACASVTRVDAARIASLSDRGSLQALVRATTGPTWLVQGGAKREVPDSGVLARYGIGSATSVVSSALLAALPVGEPVLGAGAYTDSSVDRAVVVTPGGSYSLSAATRLPVVVSGVRTLTAASFAKVSVSAALPVRLLAGSRAFVLTERGWLQVDAVHYGGSASFTQLPDGSADGIASAGSAQSPMFARERSSSQEFLVSWGSIQPVASSAEHDWIVARYGVPGTTWVVAEGGLAGIGFGPGYIARNADGTVSLYDTGVRYQITCAVAADFGKPCASLPTFTAPASWNIRAAGSLASLLADAGNRAWFVQSGVRREVPDRSVLAAYGIGSASTTVTAALLESLPVGDPVLGAGLYDDGAGNARLITPAGATYAVPAAVRITTGSIRRATLAPASLAKVVAGRGMLPLRISNRSAFSLLTADGWLSVPAGTYGALAFTPADDDLAAALPKPAGPGGPHFVREASSQTVYLASGGLQVVADEASKNWISATYGVPSTVWVVVDGALR